MLLGETYLRCGQGAAASAPAAAHPKVCPGITAGSLQSPAPAGTPPAWAWQATVANHPALAAQRRLAPRSLLPLRMAVRSVRKGVTCS